MTAAFREPDIHWGLIASSLSQPDLRHAVEENKEAISAVAGAQEMADAELDLEQRRGFSRVFRAIAWLLNWLALMYYYGILGALVFGVPGFAVYDLTGSWPAAVLVPALYSAFIPLARLRARFHPDDAREPLRSPEHYQPLVVSAALASAAYLIVKYGLDNPWIQIHLNVPPADQRGVLRTITATAAMGMFLAVAASMPFVLVGTFVGAFGWLGDQGFGRGRRRHRLVRASIHKEWEQVLLTEGVLPFLRKKLNDDLGPRYTHELDVAESPGLRTSHNGALHVLTDSGAELAGIVAARDRGSVALSGPRGTGKTSLMRAFCAGRYREEGRQPDLAFVVSAPVEYEPKEFVLHLYAALCRRVIDYARGHDPLGADPAKLFRRKWFAPRPESMGVRGVRTRPVRIGDLAESAVSRLLTVRSLQTYTGEIAGKAGYAGVELSGKRSIALATRALTYPEIVDELTDFLREVAATLSAQGGQKLPGRVVIGIDELDRLGTGERARAFLNEIKAVFVASGCFFLVSVSEDALYEFDLASPGLRTVFDSSFDEVVRVGHLGLSAARELLDHQVVGLPRQFSALVHVLSGGIPRDLVRYSAAMIDQAGGTLSEVAHRLVSLDLDRICRSAGYAVGSTSPELFAVLTDRPQAPLCDSSLSAFASRLLRLEPAALRDIVATNVALLATVLGVFGEDLSVDDTQTVDSLARVRRDSSLSPVAALDLLNRTRDVEGLRPIS